MNDTIDDDVYFGEPLTDKVDVFIAMSGINYGWNYCTDRSLIFEWPTCNALNGFYPGDDPNDEELKLQEGYVYTPITKFLREMNEDPTKEGDFTVALYSLYDFRVKPFVYGINTSIFPTMDTFFEFSDPSIDHITIKDNTAEMQYNLVKYKSFTAIENETNSEL